jgi:crossover junction endodeoxyribonuclease RusA
MLNKNKEAKSYTRFPEPIKFFVPGIPAPQGSKRAFVRNGRAIMTEDNKKTMPWRDSVAAVAMQNFSGEPLRYSLAVNVTFYFQRPSKHFNSKGLLKPRQMFYKMSKPDLDKLLRSVGDALTGIVWRDDSQIVVWEAQKRYCNTNVKFTETPGMWIQIRSAEHE